MLFNLWRWVAFIYSFFSKLLSSTTLKNSNLTPSEMYISCIVFVPNSQIYFGNEQLRETCLLCSLKNKKLNQSINSIILLYNDCSITFLRKYKISFAVNQYIYGLHVSIIKTIFNLNFNNIFLVIFE